MGPLHLTPFAPGWRGHGARLKAGFPSRLQPPRKSQVKCVVLTGWQAPQWTETTGPGAPSPSGRGPALQATLQKRCQAPVVRTESLVGHSSLPDPLWLTSQIQPWSLPATWPHLPQPTWSLSVPPPHLYLRGQRDHLLKDLPSRPEGSPLLTGALGPRCLSPRWGRHLPGGHCTLTQGRSYGQQPGHSTLGVLKPAGQGPQH